MTEFNVLIESHETDGGQSTFMYCFLHIAAIKLRQPTASEIHPLQSQTIKTINQKTQDSHASCKIWTEYKKNAFNSYIRQKLTYKRAL